MRRLLEGVAGMVLAVSAVGCADDPTVVSGTLRFGDLDISPFEFAEVIAFPEHADGFDVRSPYVGEEVLSMGTISLGDTVDVPVTYELGGYDVGDPGGPWRVMAWLTNREDSTWVAKGEHYGSRNFSFDCANGPVCGIRGVEIDVDMVAPTE